MKIETTLAQMRDDYDWLEVFRYANGEQTQLLDTHTPTPVLGCEVSGDCFGIDDVETVLGSVDGENNFRSWVVVGKLKDGRFFAIMAGCDYTGWY